MNSVDKSCPFAPERKPERKLVGAWAPAPDQVRGRLCAGGTLARVMPAECEARERVPRVTD